MHLNYITQISYQAGTANIEGGEIVYRTCSFANQEGIPVLRFLTCDAGKAEGLSQGITLDKKNGMAIAVLRHDCQISRVQIRSVLVQMNERGRVLRVIEGGWPPVTLAEVFNKGNPNIFL